ncbi:hypothetical protein OWR29_26965 [Actinoplanes sp. Pm04-4]|uniref:Uncharacterized protein n=1 Tax=Paractinoplanes pyxinae TaxID=2997416 RepID=A0ABT4B575_9ACTN|nr:hypothetical protein [Actinoplanes pyxinae]MCY1141654.1 hypothetical protein [Actinoplanes pyxinae]
MPKSHPHGGNGNDPPPPPPRRPRTAGADEPDNIAAAQARIARVAETGRPSETPTRADVVPEAGGPPWPAANDIPGSARGRDLNPPHRRHTIAGARNGIVDEQNTVYLRGHEGVAAADVRGIAAGDGVWDPVSQRYEINGRTYGVEPSGRVFPDSGAGMVKLDRNEYAALKEIVRAGGDLSAAPQLSRNPRFTANPEAVAKAKAIYDGTYEP